MNEQSSHEEVGYILLEDCEILLEVDDRCDSSSRQTGKWHTIRLQSVKDDDKDDGCDLILRETDELSWTNVTNIVPFKGLLSEVVNNTSPSPPAAASTHTDDRDESVIHESKPTAKRRSDALLLLGLAIEVKKQADQFEQEMLYSNCASQHDQYRNNTDDYDIHLRHLQVQEVQIMFWNSDYTRNVDESLSSKHESMISTLINGADQQLTVTKRKASLLVTFSLPIQPQRNNACTISDANTLENVQMKKSKPKPLPSAYKLIASIIRCDWSHLDSRMQLLQRQAKSKTKVKSTANGQQNLDSKPQFFPDSLNLENLYARISGASKHFSKVESCMDDALIVPSICTNVDTQKHVEFLDLPAEIIATPRDYDTSLMDKKRNTSIASYLRAKSLHALRVTSRKMYKLLHEIVPGLKLKLFQHQIRSLEWMEMRERKCVTEGDLLCRSKSGYSLNEGESTCGGDYHRSVTGGATVLLNSRSCVDNSTKKMFRFDAESGCKMTPLTSPSDRKTLCARGGLLCDDPGLGKTITVISLILRSIGLSTDTSIHQTPDQDHDNLFYLYWRSSFLTEQIRKPEILKLISTLIKSHEDSVWFVAPIDPVLDDCPDYFDVVSNPMCLRDIRDRCNRSSCEDFEGFEADVRLCFSNAMLYNPLEHPIHQAAQRLLKKFHEIVSAFKLNQINAAARSMHRYRAENSPNERSLVDAFEAKKRRELQLQLLPSVSTLLVVPAPLLLHWLEQMMLHIDFEYVLKDSASSRFIYYHTSKRNVIIPDSTLSLDLNNITQPLIFIDDGSKQLPPPDVLAQFYIVVTSYNRFTSEWKSGSLEQEVRASKGTSLYWGDDEPEASSLLKVWWLRVIVDEGHVMGKNTNNLIQFASWLTTERTWAMTGTPTQQIATHNSLKNLYYLTNFLKHGFFNRQLGREQCWNDLISSVWNNGNIAGFMRLTNLLSYLMVRHTKADLVEIPLPIYSSTRIELSQTEKITYNSIVSSVRTNIITTSMKGKTSGWQDSLLNPRQYKHALRALTNMRIACCGGLRVIPVILPKHWHETLVMCRELHSLDKVKVDIVNNFINRAVSGDLSGCHNCGLQLQTLFVIPCGHLVCTECIDQNVISCPICHTIFDVDDFQRLQPGLDLQFSFNLQEEKEKREQQLALERETRIVPIPENAIENNEIREEITNNLLRVRSHRKGESCIYDASSKNGKCTICKEEHFDCDFMNSKNQCELCHKFSEEPPNYASKASYVINKLLTLREDCDNGKTKVSPMAARLFGKKEFDHRPLKAIVFSEDREIYEYFGDRVIRRFGVSISTKIRIKIVVTNASSKEITFALNKGGCVADFSYAASRKQELHKFIHQPQCFVMLLSKQGSVGLDLSFVTHIFFLDSIFDKSLESQVVARAYRMGATGPVYVEELISSDSIEEVMNRMKMASGYEANIGTISDSIETRVKVHHLLNNAKLIRPCERHLSRIPKKRKLIPTSNVCVSFRE